MDKLFLVGLGMVGVYLVSVRIWPYAPCRLCKGSRTNAGSNHQRWGLCVQCGGSGRRERFGARLFSRRR
jgi:hypothetical protein